MHPCNLSFNWTFVPFDQPLPIFPPLSLSNYHSTHCFDEFDVFRFRISVKSFVFLFMTYFTWHNALEVRVFTKAGSSVFICWIVVPLCMYVCVYICISLVFIHASDSGHFGCFRVLAIVNSASVDIGVWISLWDSDFIVFGCIPRSGIARSCGNSMLNFLKISIFFPEWLYWFAFAMMVCWGSLFSNPHWHLYLYFLITAILTGVSLYLILIFGLRFTDD